MVLKTGELFQTWVGQFWAERQVVTQLARSYYGENFSHEQISEAVICATTVGDTTAEDWKQQ